MESRTITLGCFNLGTLAVLIFTVSSACAWGDAEVVTYFNANYPAASKLQEDRFTQVRGTYRLQGMRPPNVKIGPIGQGNFAIDHGYEKVSIGRPLRNHQNSSGGETVYCVGENSVFQLDRTSADDHFQVSGIGSTDAERNRYNDTFGQFVKASFSVLGVPMSRIMLSPTFRIIDAERIVVDDEDLIKVDYEVGVAKKGRVTRVTVVFDPNAGWVIRSVVHRPAILPHPLTTEVQYGPPRNGFILPHRVKIQSGGGRSTECEFSDWSFDPTPLEEFKMTYYKLPDLATEAKTSSQTFPYWLMGIALTCLALALALRHLARRGIVLNKS